MTELAVVDGSPDKHPSLRGLDTKTIIERFAEETGEEIAKSVGVTRAALSAFMLKHAEDDWKLAQVLKALSRKEDAEQLMKRADNALDLTRAREQLRSAQWDLERVCRRIYGQDAPPAGAAAVQINIGISRKNDTNDTQVIEVEHKTTD